VSGAGGADGGWGESETFLEGVDQRTPSDTMMEWIPVPELKMSSAWGILFFNSGTNESRVDFHPVWISSPSLRVVFFEKKRVCFTPVTCMYSPVTCM
jgi:hypothetical protein